MLLVTPGVVVFCPLPPKPNGIADYLAEQLPYFSQALRVCVVIENTAPTPEGIPASIIILRLSEYLAQAGELAHIPHLYHVGNNPDTRYMLPVLLNRPGIVMVHDLNLHYLIDLTNLSQGDKPGYVNALFNQYGSAGKVIGEQLVKYNWKGAHMPHELFMNGSIIKSAAHIIVHSEYSARSIGAMGHAHISVIPHHLSPQLRQHQTKMKMTYRKQLGLSSDKCIITSMGFIAKAKQIRAVLASLSELKQSGKQFIYVLAGQCKQHEYDVFQDIAEFGLQDEVIVTGFLSSDDFFKYLIASDFIVNLRYPTGGESSGTLTRALGLGLGCIVVNVGPFAEIPDECAIKLEFDEHFAKALTNALDELISQPHKRMALGFNAKRWVESSHDIMQTTRAYLAVVNTEQKRLDELSEAIKQKNKLKPVESNTVWHDYPSEQQILMFTQQQSALILQNNQAGFHWWRNATLPLHTHESFLYVSEHQDGLNIAVPLFELTADCVVTLSAQALSDGTVASTNMPCEQFLAIVPARLVEADPVRVFAHLNALLSTGAIGSLSLVWDSPVISDVELSRIAILHYLNAAGFAVQRYFTGQHDVDMTVQQTNSAFEQEWCFELKKHADMVNLSPQPYYPGGCSTLLNSAKIIQGHQ